MNIEKCIDNLLLKGEITKKMISWFKKKFFFFIKPVILIDFQVTTYCSGVRLYRLFENE